MDARIQVCTCCPVRTFSGHLCKTCAAEIDRINRKKKPNGEMKADVCVADGLAHPVPWHAAGQENNQ